MRIIMKRSTKTIAAVVAIAAAGSIALAGASVAERGFGRHHGSPGGFVPRALAMLQEFDLDKDGKLTQAEIDGAQQSRMAEFDSDKDGRLNLAEFQGLWLDRMHERMVDQFQRLDADGDAIITDTEFHAPMAFIVVRADRNGDGALSFEDIGRRAGKGKGHGGKEQDKDD
jgi:hypothetical protein